MDDEEWDRHFEENAVCIVGDAHGIYVPQYFVTNKDTEVWHIKPEDVEILKAGPEHKHYWETWDEVLDYAYCMENGKRYSLWQDGNLFAIPDAD